jgi:enoyl-CoA hydratase/carnithine racemase
MKASTTGSDAVTYRSADRIATITIDRAERMNRIDADVVEGLHAAGTGSWATRPAWRS